MVIRNIELKVMSKQGKRRNSKLHKDKHKKGGRHCKLQKVVKLEETPATSTATLDQKRGNCGKET